MRPTIVELANVWVSRGETIALRDVSFEIEEGRFVGLMGPNGGGKTTLIKTILGLIKPDRGSVTVSRHGMEPIGYVPQEEHIDLDFPVTGYDVVEMGLYGMLGIFSRISAGDRARVREALGLVGMGKLARRRIGTLSGGEKQRIFIARAIVAKPRLLILDEPTAGIDANARDDFYRLLSNLREKFSLTILLASHDIAVIPSKVDEVICINQRIFVHAAPDEIKDAGDFREAYGCELEFVTHGKYPHRVLEHHDGESEDD